MRLSDLVGQGHAVAMLRRALDTERVPHAYLFEGQAGVGKRSAAYGLSLALTCRKEPRFGCGACNDCRRVLGGMHPDVRAIVPDGTQIKIDQVRDIALLAARRPHEAPARVIILDPADALNDAAANGLLKSLEEPTSSTHFVLVTAAPDNLLPTIRSRTQRVRFVPVPATDIAALLETRSIDPARAQPAAAMAGGSVARALELAAEDAPDVWQPLDGLRAAAAAGSVGAVFDATAALGGKENRAALPGLLTLAALFYRDAIAMACGADDVVLLRERAAQIRKLADTGTTAAGRLRLRQAWAAILEATAAINANVNPELAVEHMLLALRSCERAAAR